MNAFTVFANHTQAQKKGFLITAAIAAAAAFAGFLGMAALGGNNEAARTVILVILGIATGISARRSAIAAWGYATGNPLVWTGVRKFGIAWRAIAALCLGRFILAFLVGMASSELGSTIAVAFGTCVCTFFAMLLGQQYGYNQATTEAGGNIARDNVARNQDSASVNAPVGGQVVSQVEPSIAVGTRVSSQVAADKSAKILAHSQAATIAAADDRSSTQVPVSSGHEGRMGGRKMTGGNVEKGKWGLRAAAVLVVLFLGFLGFNYAKQFAPKDVAVIAQNQAFSNSLTGDSNIQSATTPPGRVAASGGSEAPAAALAVPAQPAAELDMMLYKDMQVLDLLKDRVFGKKVIAIVPSARMECLKSTLSSMRALSLDGGRNAISDASGSHADNWIEGYVQASPDGQLDVVVDCGESSNANSKQYTYFTTRGINAAVPDGLRFWLSSVSQGDGNLTVFDGKQQKDLAIATLTDDLQQNVAVELKSSISEVNISGQSFSTVGGELKVANTEPDDTGTQVLNFKGETLAGIDDDHVSLEKAYRYGDRDVVLVTHACAGSACGFTSVALVEVTASGRAMLFDGDEMTINTDGQVPDVQIQADGSLEIAFTGFKGKEQWSYAHGKLTKEG